METMERTPDFIFEGQQRQAVHGSKSKTQNSPTIIVMDEEVEQKSEYISASFAFVFKRVVGPTLGFVWLYTTLAFWNVVSVPMAANGLLKPALMSIQWIGVSGSLLMAYPMFRIVHFSSIVINFFKHGDVEYKIWGNKVKNDIFSIFGMLCFVVLISTTEHLAGWDYIKNPYGPNPDIIIDTEHWNINHPHELLLNGNGVWVFYPNHIGGNVAVTMTRWLINERIEVDGIKVWDTNGKPLVVLIFMWGLFTIFYRISHGYRDDLVIESKLKELAQKKTLVLDRLPNLKRKAAPEQVNEDYTPIDIPVLDEVVKPAPPKEEIVVPPVAVPGTIILPQEQSTSPPNTVIEVINKMFADHKINVQVIPNKVIESLRCMIIPLKRHSAVKVTDLQKDWIVKEIAQNVSELFFKKHPNWKENYNPSVTCFNYHGNLSIQVDNSPNSRKFLKTTDNFSKIVRTLLEYKKQHPKSTPMLMGMRTDASFIIQNLSDALHICVQGATKSGKGVSHWQRILPLLFTNSPNHLQLIIIDNKGEFAAAFKKHPVPHVLSTKKLPLLAINNREKALGLLKSVTKEMNNRQKLVTEAGASNIYALKARPKEIILLIPELTDLVEITEDTPKEATAIIKQIKAEINGLLRKARFVGIYIHVDTQEANKGTTLSGLSNVETRISMKTKNPASVFLGVSKLEAPTEKLQGAGDFFGIFGDEGLVRGHTFFTDQDSPEVGKLLKLITKKWSKLPKK